MNGLSQEIKVNGEDVKTAISKMDRTMETFKTKLLEDFAAGNELDVVKKINELNHQLEAIGQTYEEILKANNQSVRTAIQEIEKVDQQLSTSINAH
ncbi:DUF5344 family protein [Peribacillus sp. NPDC097675]|uniref:DUF5344 family protein n=1 Tax=Peribacillus sp. NPDC097675 TaxID=3390618 RepID=UPI003D002425